MESEIWRHERLKGLESENARLKKLLTNSMLEIDAMRELLKGKWWPWRPSANA